MVLAENINKVLIVPVLVVLLALTGCSSTGNNDEDLFFEEDFGTEFESKSKPKDVPAAKKEKEDDFFSDDPKLAAKPKSESQPTLSKDEDFFSEELAPQPAASPEPAPKLMMESAEKIPQQSGVIGGGGGFVSVDQKTDRNEFNMDVAALHTQQIELMSRVQELQKIVHNLEPRLTATQERVESSLKTGAQSPQVQADIQSLKSEIDSLKQEITSLKEGKVRPSKQSKLIQKIRPLRSFKRDLNTPKEYDQALAAYHAGKYDESILKFQELSLKNPPTDLQDNILFWMGNSYLKLNMFDEAIKHFQTVVKKYPKGNKVHDSRYMLGVSYQKKGDTGRALDALEAALKSHPPTAVRQKIEKQLMEIQ